jgi:hypothetical protein
MAGTLTELAVAGKLALRALGRRMRSEVEAAPDLDQFQADMEQLLAGAPGHVVRDHCWLSLQAQKPPWFASRMQLEAGDEVSYFVEGRAYANAFLDIYVKPSLNLWCKVGDQGEIFRGTRASHSFIAKTSGELKFGNYFPNDWADTQGTRKLGDDIYKEMSGELRILVIRWAQGAEPGLKELGSSGDVQGRVKVEQERIAQGDTTPAGWHYLWHLGPAEIYRARTGEKDQACIHCHTHEDVGILQKNVDLPLDESTEISWRWCIGQLPSSIREDAVPSHDYLSLAIEFDNGRDITYYWSSTLPVGTGYDCPLPNWKGIEYHVVVRSGHEGLGQWQDERRNLYQDYLKYMGEAPTRITRVWLIANSVFQRGVGDCDYAGIELHSQAGTKTVL